MPIHEQEPEDDRRFEDQEWLQNLRRKTAEAEAALNQALADGRTNDAQVIVGTIAYGRVYMLESYIRRLEGRISELEEKIAMYTSEGT